MKNPRVQAWMEGWIHRRIGVHFDLNIEFSPRQVYEVVDFVEPTIKSRIV